MFLEIYKEDISPDKNEVSKEFHDDFIYHTVLPGETLLTISFKFFKEKFIVNIN